jgi:hypothetical protein
MPSFKALEQSGWTKKPSAYDEHFKTDSVYAYTTWLSPQQGWDMFDLLMKAVLSVLHSGRRRADEGPQMFERSNMSATQRPHNNDRFGKFARFHATS